VFFDFVLRALYTVSTDSLEVSVHFFNPMPKTESLPSLSKGTGHYNVYDLTAILTEKMVVRECFKVIPGFGSSNGYSTDQAFF